MSGFEIAGIILGAYPVITGVLEAYKATRGGKGAISFARHLRTEEIIYKEFILHLVEPSLSAKEIAIAKKAAPFDAALWSDAAFQDDIRVRLGQEKADNLIDILCEIKELLDTLEKELAPIDDGIELLRKFRSRMRLIRQNMPKAKLREQLDDLTARNTQLQRLLTDRSLPSETPNRRASKPLRRYLWRERSHAIDIYNALCDAYNCQCPVPHRANFGLPRIADNPRTDSDTINAWQFELVFAIERSPEENSEPKTPNETQELTRHWSQVPVDCDIACSCTRVSISACDKGFDRTQLEHIRDLCEFSRSLHPTAFSPDLQMGFLELKEKKYQLQAPTNSRNDSQKVEHLDHLLKDEHFLLSRKERISLALSLSHAVLSCYSTPWIEARWTWNDFCIDRSNEGQLFAARKFYSSCNKETSECQRSISGCWEISGEPILTRLGFALVELALAKRLEELRSGHEFKGADLDTLDFLTAKKLLESGQIERAESKRYEDIVRICLRHQFISDSEVIGLDSSHPNFHENAEQSIIAPLHTIVNASWGTG